MFSQESHTDKADTGRENQKEYEDIGPSVGLHRVLPTAHDMGFHSVVNTLRSHVRFFHKSSLTDAPSLTTGRNMAL